MKAVRIIRSGFMTNLKMLGTSSFFLLTSIVQPVIFATIAYYMFQSGGRIGDAALRRARRGDDGRLVDDAVRLRRDDPVAALAGNARARRRRRRPR